MLPPRLFSRGRAAIWCLLFLLSGFSVPAQTRVLDSLARLIQQSKSDTERIRLTNKQVDALINVNLDSGIALGVRNQAAAVSIHDLSGEAGSCIGLASLYCFKGNFVAAKAQLSRAGKLYSLLKDSKGNMRLLGGYGMYYGMQSLYDSSVVCYKEAIRLATISNDSAVLTRNYQNLATDYTMLSDYSQAILYYDKATKTLQAATRPRNLAFINLNKGLVYMDIEDYVRAKNVLVMALALARDAGLKNVECYAELNLASVYDDFNQPDSTYFHAMNAVRIARQTGDQGAEASALARAGMGLGNMKRFSEAMPLLKQAVLLADSSGELTNVFQTNSDFGKVLMQQQQYPAALRYYKKAFAAMKSSNQLDPPMARSYLALSECYEKNGDYREALIAYKASSKILDSARSRENIRKGTELSMNQEFERTQQREKENQLERDLKQQSKQRLLAGGLVLTVVLAGVGFFAFSAKQKANRVLEHQKTALQSAMTDLRSAQAQLIQSEKMASLGELTAGIAHEIQNPLNFVNNFSEVSAELLGELEDALSRGDAVEAKQLSGEVVRNLEKILHHGKRADGIVKGMLQHSRSGSDKKELTDINTLTDEYVRLAYHGLRAKDKSFNAELVTDFHEPLEKIAVVSQEIGRVVLNLLTNAFYAVNERKKRSAEEGVTFSPRVVVRVLKAHDAIEIRVKDNGTGIPEHVREKIFQPFFTTKPTNEGTGLGLSLSYDIVRAHGGKIRIDTEAGVGTEFIVSLPSSSTPFAIG